MLIDSFCAKMGIDILRLSEKFCQMLPQPQSSVQQRSGSLLVAWVVNCVSNESVVMNNYSVSLFPTTHISTKEENSTREKYLSNWKWCGLPAENWQLQVTSCARQYEWELLCNWSILHYDMAQNCPFSQKKLNKPLKNEKKPDKTKKTQRRTVVFTLL